MAGKLHLDISTPERLLVREQVSEVQVPAANGYIGILPEHAPLLAELGTGELVYLVDGRRRSLAISGGWVEVSRDSVHVLATMAERADEIDAASAKEALRSAEESLAHPDVGIDVARALNAMTRARARLDTSEHK